MMKNVTVNLKTKDMKIKIEIKNRWSGATVNTTLPFSDNWQEECESGIHFFITKIEAENY